MDKGLEVCCRETSLSSFLLKGELPNLSSIFKKNVRNPSYDYVIEVDHTPCNE